MKRTFQIMIVLFMAILLSIPGYTQTWSEWFRQKKTQRKYLLEQIIKLQIYLGHVKKGYSIAQEGLTIIGDIKKGDWLQHLDYFTRLKQVNPVVRQYARLPAIINKQTQMMALYRKYSEQFDESGAFGEREIRHIQQVFVGLLDEVADDIDAVIRLTSDYAIEMTDRERIKQLDIVGDRIDSKYEFLFSFCQQTEKQQMQRSRELQDVKKLRKLYYP